MNSINEIALKTFVWKSFELKGFHVSRQDYRHFLTSQRERGKIILRKELPKILGENNIASFDPLIKELADTDPRFLSRFELVAGSGYTQGILIHELGQCNDKVRGSVGLISSILFLSFSMFDYIIDELHLGKEIFEIIGYRELIQLLDFSTVPEKFLSALQNKISRFDKKVYLFLLILCACKLCIWKVYAGSKSDDAYRELGKLISQLYEYEKEFVDKQDDFPGLRNHFENMSEAKSSIPQTSSFIASKIADPFCCQNGNEIRCICKIIGRIFRISDDLADISIDFILGVPSHINKEEIWIIEGGKKYLDPERLCSTLIDHIEQVLNLVEDLKEKVRAIPTVDHSKLLTYVTMYIYTWIGFD